MKDIHTHTNVKHIYTYNCKIYTRHLQCKTYTHTNVTHIYMALTM